MNMRPKNQDNVLVTPSGITWDAEDGHTYVAYGNGVRPYHVSHHAECPCGWFESDPMDHRSQVLTPAEMRRIVG
jgi:hypothetical protein